MTDNYDANSGGSFDPNHAWTELSAAGSKVDFSEFDLSGGSGPFGGALGDGGTLRRCNWVPGGAADAQRAWRKSIYRRYHDCRATGGWIGADRDGALRRNNGGLAFRRSDFNFDGQINIADWTTFLTNNGTNMSTLTVRVLHPWRFERRPG